MAKLVQLGSKLSKKLLFQSLLLILHLLLDSTKRISSHFLNKKY